VISLLSAPSNLGLRPPHATSVPGTAKAPEALREAGLFTRFAALGARDAGTVLPGRYADDATPGRLRNHDLIVDHARRVAARLTQIRTAGDTPLVVGGDCSLIVGAGLALRTAPGRYGLVHLDGHTDFRHPGNSAGCAALAGEDLAAAIGRHWPAIADLDGLGPYFRPEDTVHAGCRDDDGRLPEVRDAIALALRSSDIIRDGAAAAAGIRARLTRPDLDGYWLHLDVDILDPEVLPAVDSPSPGGLSAEQLTELLAALAPGAVGAQITVFDPDLDPDGRYARVLTDALVAGLAGLGKDRKG
jgi:arginase